MLQIPDFEASRLPDFEASRLPDFLSSSLLLQTYLSVESFDYECVELSTS